MGNTILVTSTDNTVDSNFPKVTGTTLGDKHMIDVAVPGGVASAIYATIVDEPSSTVTYVGNAETGSSESDLVWQIKKITVTGTVTKIEWADGNSNFDNSWTNRASLTYS